MPIWVRIISRERRQQIPASLLGEIMKQLGRTFLVAAVLVAAMTSSAAKAEVAFIQPTINLELPQISFTIGVNPTLTYSTNALNVLRAHRVALQQVQAAIMFLTTNRKNILAGQNAAYNAAFGDFYNPNSQFAGQYNRTVQTPIGVDGKGNLIYRTDYNTAHYDRVLYVYQQVQQALQSSITYALGAQPVVNEDGTIGVDPVFNAYRTQTVTVIDPQFGNIQNNDELQRYATFADRGIFKWGLSSSSTPKHLANPSLPWYDDNDRSTATAPLTADQEMAFFHDKLDAYATVATTIETDGDDVIVPETVYLGNAFFTESERDGDLFSGIPQDGFSPTEFHQYQMIIAALAEANGSTTNLQIYAGLNEVFGETSDFLAAFDSGSYASFASGSSTVPGGNFGDGSLLPPPGKNATDSDNFFPYVPGS
jgi:hypothetical protein